MGALNLQELGAPKVLVKPNALQGQTLTNQPGQVVVDYTRVISGNTKHTSDTVYRTHYNLHQHLLT